MNVELLETVPIVVGMVLVAMRGLKALPFAGQGWYAHIEPLLPFPFAFLAAIGIAPDLGLGDQVTIAWLGAASAMSAHAVWTQTVRGRDGRIIEAKERRASDRRMKSAMGAAKPAEPEPREPPDPEPPK